MAATVILGITAGRSYNSGFVVNQDYWMGKMLEAYADYQPFTQLYSAIGIEASDWWMLDEHGEKKPMLNGSCRRRHLFHHLQANENANETIIGFAS